ncbi:conserved membrane hypothetical protein [Verrucomicrobia bacterium]|nr:conserved membrane hypothetical protein [Verrucomicrobiota bacterium]
MNVGRWLHEHSLKLLAIRDTPQSIAGGVAIGIFFGFTPLWGLKTLLSIFLAWLTRSNIIAAVLAGSLHDVVFPFMPLIWRWEYDLGYWILSNPHGWPPRLNRIHWGAHSWREWTHTLFFGVGKFWLVGSVLLGSPLAVVSFVVTKEVVAQHQRKKRAAAEAAAPDEENPS